MILFKKIKAAALQFAILASALIIILLCSFLALTQTRIFFDRQSSLLLSSIEGANYGLTDKLNSLQFEKDTISFPYKTGRVILKKEYWGGYQKITSTALLPSKKFSKKTLIGERVSFPITAIQVTDNKLPLQLVGNAEIKGDIYISEKGIKPGIINGNSFNGKELVFGKIKRNYGVLPDLDSDWLNYNKNLLNYRPYLNNTILNGELEYKNSFFKETTYIYNKGPLVISDKYIGNIIIISESQITVTKEANLTDITIVAPIIIIKSNFKGSANFLAQEQIIVEDNAFLNYPSSLTVLNENIKKNGKVSEKEKSIFISENAIVQGNIIYINQKKEDTNVHTDIELANSSLLEGSIYCQGNIELSGTVIGSVYTHRFIANKFGSKYVNYIYNGKILAKDVHSQYCGLPFQISKKGIVKWLY